MKNRVLKTLRTRLSSVLGCSGLLLAVTSFVSPVVHAAALVWNPPGGPDTANWTAGQTPTAQAEGIYVEQRFGPFNGVFIRIRLTPLRVTAGGAVNDSTIFAGNQLLLLGDDVGGAFVNQARGGRTAAAASRLVIAVEGVPPVAVGSTGVARIDVVYEDAAGNPVVVENPAFSILDVDTDPNNQWQDQVTVTAFNSATRILPTAAPGGTVPVTLSSNDRFGVIDLPLPAPPTYNIVGNVATGIPNADAPNPGPNGNLFIQVNGATTQTRFDYSYGPATQGVNLTHAIGLDNVFFQPVRIGTAKDIINARQEADGTTTFTYRVVVQNFGEVELRNVQAVENLAPTFANATSFRVTDIRLTGLNRTGTPTPNINPNFNGTTDTNLLNGTGTLLAQVVNNTTNAVTTNGGSITLEFDVNVTPNFAGPGGYGPFNNQVEARGTSPTGANVTDLSNDEGPLNTGQLDPDNDGDPTDNNNPTIANITQNPRIGVAKTTSAPQPGGAPGVFNFDLTLTVTNSGNVPLNDVQLTEDLQDALITSAANRADSFLIRSTPTLNSFTGTGTAPTINGGYTGAGVNTLFNAGNTFNPGDTAVVTIPVQVNLGVGGPGPLNDSVLDATNQVAASGAPATGGPAVTDLSQDGRDVDPDGDGDPTNNNVQTPLRIPFPSIGVAKAVSTPQQIAGTTEYEFTYTLRVTNFGTTPLENVQLVENLQATLITNARNRADSFTIGPVTIDTTGVTAAGSIAPTLNGVYDGNAVSTLFNPGSLLNPNDTVVVTIPVRADLGSGSILPPLNDGVLNVSNTATASGTVPAAFPGIGGTTVSDLSQSGTNVDPDGDGNPANNNAPTPTIIGAAPISSALTVVKRITNIFRQGTPIAIQGIAQFNDQPNDINNSDVALNSAFAAAGVNNQPAGIFELPAGVELQPGDQVEYTIYAWNNGGELIRNVTLCDALQPPSILNADTFQLQAPGTLTNPLDFDDVVGTLIQARSPLDPIDGTADPLEAGCIPTTTGSFLIGPPGPANAGGGVVAGPFELPVNQFGAIRFRVNTP